MSMSNDIFELATMVEQLLAMLEALVKEGSRSAALFADDMRRQLDELRKAIASGDRIRLATRLLNVVPSARDLDAVNFRLDLHPEIRELSNEIAARAARIAKPLIDEL